MTTSEPPDEPTPPSFEKPPAGGSPYETPPPPPYGAPPPYGHQPPNGSPQPGLGAPLYDPDRSGTNPYGPTPFGNAPVAAMPPLGGLGRRLVARIIDYLLLAVIGVPLALLAYSGSSHDRTARSIGADAIVVLVAFVYEGLMLTLSRGQTVGKKAMRIRVAVLSDGSVPSGSKGWIRSAVFWLPGLFSALCIPAVFSLLNILWCTWDRPYRQCIHDKAARTVVVRTD
jgi:uncharacterized RDD family membrane protein YckC